MGVLIFLRMRAFHLSGLGCARRALGTAWGRTLAHVAWAHVVFQLLRTLTLCCRVVFLHEVISRVSCSYGIWPALWLKCRSDVVDLIAVELGGGGKS